MKRDRLAWPILLLLLTVLIPSVGVVWMMREAVRNEREATRQRLQDAYAAQLETATQSVQEKWRATIERLAGLADADHPAKSFATLVASGDVDSVLIRDLDGNVVYPNVHAQADEATVEPTETDHRWQRARLLEYQQDEPLAAARVFAQLAAEANDPSRVALARMAQARCLSKAGDRVSALEQLAQVAADETLRDVHGRSLAAIARLRSLELLDRDAATWADEAKELQEQLTDYGHAMMPASQRLFLMNRLDELSPVSIEWPTRDAEAIAASCLDSFNLGQAKGLASGLNPTAVPELWSHVSDDGTVVALFQTDTLTQRLGQHCQTLPTPAGVTMEVTSPDQDMVESLATRSLGDALGNWQLSLVASEGDPFAASSRQRAAVQVWIAALTVAATCVLGWLVWNSLRRRLHLAQLKNDLVATVSHELKTPLASIRLLVDTLLANEDGDTASPARSREYLQLIAKENARLTRLIDNFLTFSRLERGSQTLQLREISLTQVIDQARTVFLNHIPDAQSSLQTDVAANVTLHGDVDSLVTAIVNLLENAWKYSAGERQIKLLGRGNDQSVTISVSDNGIGLDAAAQSHAFDRFYQVDQRVARDSSGCGLGLSIVQSIVHSHGGSVAVESEPHQGSQFTISLPRVAETRKAV